jgi:hypothetical protein
MHSVLVAAGDVSTGGAEAAHHCFGKFVAVLALKAEGEAVAADGAGGKGAGRGQVAITDAVHAGGGCAHIVAFDHAELGSRRPSKIVQRNRVLH